MKMREAVKNTLLAAAIFLLALVLSILIQTLGVREHVTTVFVFAVFLISLLTEGYVYGVVSAVAGTLAVNYAFTYPYFTLNFTVRRNLISAVIMVTIAVLTGMLTTRVKQHKAAKAESEKERMRANLLRAVSHDLRTPLTTIYSASSTLLDKREQLTDQQRDLMLKSIQEDSEWLVRMVENLLSITRIGSERIEIAKTPVILDELIDSAMTKFHSRYPGQEVALELPGGHGGHSGGRHPHRAGPHQPAGERSPPRRGDDHAVPAGLHPGAPGHFRGRRQRLRHPGGPAQPHLLRQL